MWKAGDVVVLKYCDMPDNQPIIGKPLTVIKAPTSYVAPQWMDVQYNNNEYSVRGSDCIRYQPKDRYPRMTRRYAIDEYSGERFLRLIECDAPGCNATIKPNPDISSSGWVKVYSGEVMGDIIINADVTDDYCPDDAHLAPSNKSPFY